MKSSGIARDPYAVLLLAPDENVHLLAPVVASLDRYFVLGAAPRGAVAHGSQPRHEGRHEGVLARHGDELDPTCGNCGAPESLDGVAGAQGRSPEEIRQSAIVAGICLALVALIVAGCWIASVVR